LWHILFGSSPIQGWPGSNKGWFSCGPTSSCVHSSIAITLLWIA
jgi:hypothetical protein